jgi:TatA/E family protein of Tat protein translocase
MPFGLGTSELVIIMVIALLVFGAKRLPEIGSSVGKGIRDFKRSLKDVEHTIGDQEPPPPPPLERHTEADRPKKLSE